MFVQQRIKKKKLNLIPLPHLLYSHLQGHKVFGSHVAEPGSVKTKPALHPTDPDPRGFTVQRALTVAHATSFAFGLSLAA